jgi:hypothetical protein
VKWLSRNTRMTDTPSRRWLSTHAMRSVASVFCLTLAVATVILWARSYFWADEITYVNRTFTELRSYCGRIESYTVQLTSPLDVTTLHWHCRSAKNIRLIADENRKRGTPVLESMLLGFGWGSVRKGQTGVMVPHWVFVAGMMAAALALKPKPRYRFSLFDCLATTTFAALLAGVVSWFVRLRG